jgi:N-acetylglucosamine-6-phosphate deacetylase
VVPADLIGMGNPCGRIKIGSCPDIIAWDTDLKVIKTWLKNYCLPNEL